MAFIRYLALSLFHTAAVLAVLFAYAVSTGQLDQLIQFDFIFWDANHFLEIRDSGYNALTVAFFPGFPMIWKLLGWSAPTISLLNYSLFVVGASLLGSILRISNWLFLLLLCLPSLVFMALPYPEAMLFVCYVGVVYGLLSRKLWLVFFGLFLASLFKANVAVLVPVMLGVFIWWGNRSREDLAGLLLGLLAVISGTMCSLLFQYKATGEWFGFFRAQFLWGNELRWPVWPLSSWGTLPSILLDAVSLWIALLAGIYLVWSLTLSRARREKDQLIAWSAAYLAFTGLFVLFFRGGSLFSLNRFVFAVPFFWVFAAGIIRNPPPAAVRVGLWSWVLISLSFGCYVHIQHVIKFVLIGVALWLCQHVLFSMHSRSGRWLPALYPAGLLLQVFFIWRMTRLIWLG